MSSILFYCLQLVLCSTVLFTYYLCCLKNGRFHQYNRFFLLSIPVVSALVPLARIEYVKQPATEAEATPLKFFEVVADNNTHMEEFVVQTTSTTDWNSLLFYGYLLVCLVMAGLLLRSLLRIYSLLRKAPCKHIGEAWLVHSKAKGTPFSFFRFIFWNDEIDITSRVGRQVLKHELAHIKEKHSIDKLAMAILLCFAWFNPVFWLLKKEIDMVHEFIADKAAVDDDASGLAEMLLTACYPSVNFGIASSFFHSPLKRRLAMIKNIGFSRFHYLRKLMMLPILGLVILLFAFRTQVATIVGIEPVNKPAPAVEPCDPGQLRSIVKTRLVLKPVVNTVVGLNRVYRVMLDAGHGGHDGGASAEDGTLEKEVALELVKTILEENTNKNIRLILTRGTDEYQHPVAKSELSKKNNADLFVSLHAASDENRDARGIELFVPTSDTLPHYKASYNFANMIANKLMGVHGNVQIKQRKVGIWVVNASACPAVLIEAGYLSNKDDLQKLKDKNYQRKLARAILKGIEAYLAKLDC